MVVPCNKEAKEKTRGMFSTSCSSVPYSAITLSRKLWKQTQLARACKKHIKKSTETLTTVSETGKIKNKNKPAKRR